MLSRSPFVYDQNVLHLHQSMLNRVQPAMPPSEAEPIEEWRLVLLRAADLLMEKGWIQHEPSSTLGLCATGAITRVARENGRRLALRALNKEIYEQGYFSIVGWNDWMPGQTRENVVATIRRAATR